MEKIRLKFTKLGNLKYIGHLDLLSLFERMIKRADIPVAFSEGFNPRAKMSFAHPLAVGIESDCEFMEIELAGEVDFEVTKNKLNSIAPDGMEILEIAESSSNKAIMALVQSAEYEIKINATSELDKEKVEGFLNQSEIVVGKIGKIKGKKVLKTVNIKPLIISYNISDDVSKIRLELVAGSADNLRPDTLMDEISKIVDIDDYNIKRTAIKF